jgi:aminoglycoside phosphotransferase (APT) family kinase protein
VDAEGIAGEFALGRAVRLSDGPVARGKQGVVWRLDTSDGSWAVKVPLHPSNEDDVAVTAVFQEAACEAGVGAPRVRRTTRGSVFATVAGIQVRVYEWVDLLASSRRLDPELVGETVAAIHRVSGVDGGTVHPWYQAPIGASRWDELISALAQQGAPFAARLAGLREELVALESWIEAPQRLQLCHRDLWSDNVLPTASGGVCVVDWENAGLADPGQELACVLFEFADSDPGRARALMRAYERAGGPARVTRREDFTMLIAQLGHIAELAAMDWLQPNERNPLRSDSEAWIGEMLDEPHTRGQLESLLDAIR